MDNCLSRWKKADARYRSGLGSQQDVLQALTRSRTCSQALAQRADMILLAFDAVSGKDFKPLFSGLRRRLNEMPAAQSRQNEQRIASNRTIRKVGGENFSAAFQEGMLQPQPVAHLSL